MAGQETLILAILASSNKARPDGSYGRCIAAITQTGEWVRLVADGNGASIPEKEAQQLSTGKVIEADIVRVPLDYQKENAILRNFRLLGHDAERYFQNIIPVNEVGIFGNTSNRLSIWEINPGIGTFRLLKVEDLLTYRRENENCKAKFIYNGIQYNEMAMTDPNWYAKQNTERPIGQALIVVSLPDSPVFNKFIAAIHPLK